MKPNDTDKAWEQDILCDDKGEEFIEVHYSGSYSSGLTSEMRAEATTLFNADLKNNWLKLLKESAEYTIEVAISQAEAAKKRHAVAKETLDGLITLEE